MNSLSIAPLQQGAPVLAIEQLCIGVRRADRSLRRVVDTVDLHIDAGEIVALVGESGSGKTMIGRAILQLLPSAVQVESGSIRLCGRDLLQCGPAAMQAVRGSEVGMVFQEPLVSLNPALRIGVQMMESLRQHRTMSEEAARAACLAMLARVRIVRPEACFDAYPHEFSGGMRQRIMLASVMLARPKLLIADEPTTALDALSQKEVMDIMAELAFEFGTAVLLVSHDLGLVSHYAQRVVVMRLGQLIETGTTRDILLAPTHAYTRALLDALPSRRDADSDKRIGDKLIEVRRLCVSFAGKAERFWRKAARTMAVNCVDLDIRKGETLALVGESGSGKTTIGRTLTRLARETGGTIRFNGEDVAAFEGRQLQDYRRQIQMVFQDPFSSLDPRMNLTQIVAEGLRNVPDLNRQQRLERARLMLREVGITEEQLERFPHELSGGQRQRVCIARAIVGEPQLVVADEPVSALDLTIQKQVLDLLVGLQAKFGFTYLFISHDLGVVEQIADRVAVMYRGRIIEIGSRQAIYGDARHPYTLTLLRSTPRLKRSRDGGYHLSTPELAAPPPPEGFEYFNERATGDLVMVAVGDDHAVACIARG